VGSLDVAGDVAFVATCTPRCQTATGQTRRTSGKGLGMTDADDCVQEEVDTRTRIDRLLNYKRYIDFLIERELKPPPAEEEE